MTNKSKKIKNLEKKIITNCLIFSIVIHLIIALTSFFKKKSLKKHNFESITAELFIPKEIKDKKNSQKKLTNKIKETKVEKNILPQLTKNFVIKDKPKNNKKIKNSYQEQKEQKEQVIKRLKAIELTKKEALKRLAREKARLEKKIAEQEQLALQEKLAKIQAIKSRTRATHNMAVNKDKASYGNLVQSWLHQNYQLPEAYDLSFQNNEVLLEVVLNKIGDVLFAKILKPSKSPIFDKLVLNTVWKSSPFPKPPNDWVGKNIKLTFTP